MISAITETATLRSLFMIRTTIETSLLCFFMIGATTETSILRFLYDSRDHRNINTSYFTIRATAETSIIRFFMIHTTTKTSILRFFFYDSHDHRNINTPFFMICVVSSTPAGNRGRGCRMDIADRVPGPGPTTHPQREKRPRCIPEKDHVPISLKQISGMLIIFFDTS